MDFGFLILQDFSHLFELGVIFANLIQDSVQILFDSLDLLISIEVFDVCFNKAESIGHFANLSNLGVISFGFSIKNVLFDGPVE